MKNLSVMRTGDTHNLNISQWYGPRYRVWLKSIAIAVVGVFLFQQIAWTGDLGDLLRDEEQEMEQLMQTFEDAEEAQLRQEELLEEFLPIQEETETPVLGPEDWLLPFYDLIYRIKPDAEGVEKLNRILDGYLNPKSLIEEYEIIEVEGDKVNKELGPDDWLIPFYGLIYRIKPDADGIEKIKNILRGYLDKKSIDVEKQIVVIEEALDFPMLDPNTPVSIPPGESDYIVIDPDSITPLPETSSEQQAIIDKIVNQAEKLQKIEDAIRGEYRKFLSRVKLSEDGKKLSILNEDGNVICTTTNPTLIYYAKLIRVLGIVYPRPEKPEGVVDLGLPIFGWVMVQTIPGLYIHICGVPVIYINAHSGMTVEELKTELKRVKNMLIPVEKNDLKTARKGIAHLMKRINDYIKGIKKSLKIARSYLKEIVNPDEFELADYYVEDGVLYAGFYIGDNELSPINISVDMETGEPEMDEKFKTAILKTRESIAGRMGVDIGKVHINGIGPFCIAGFRDRSTTYTLTARVKRYTLTVNTTLYGRVIIHYNASDREIEQSDIFYTITLKSFIDNKTGVDYVKEAQDAVLDLFNPETHNIGSGYWRIEGGILKLNIDLFRRDYPYLLKLLGADIPVEVNLENGEVRIKKQIVNAVTQAREETAQNLKIDIEDVRANRVYLEMPLYIIMVWPPRPILPTYYKLSLSTPQFELGFDYGIELGTLRLTSLVNRDTGLDLLKSAIDYLRETLNPVELISWLQQTEEKLIFVFGLGDGSIAVVKINIETGEIDIPLIAVTTGTKPIMREKLLTTEPEPTVMRALGPAKVEEDAEVDGATETATSIIESLSSTEIEGASETETAATKRLRSAEAEGAAGAEAYSGSESSLIKTLLIDFEEFLLKYQIRL